MRIVLLFLLLSAINCQSKDLAFNCQYGTGFTISDNPPNEYKSYLLSIDFGDVGQLDGRYVVQLHNIYDSYILGAGYKFQTTNELHNVYFTPLFCFIIHDAPPNQIGFGFNVGLDLYEMKNFNLVFNTGLYIVGTNTITYKLPIGFGIRYRMPNK